MEPRPSLCLSGDNLGRMNIQQLIPGGAFHHLYGSIVAVDELLVIPLKNMASADLSNSSLNLLSLLF